MRDLGYERQETVISSNYTDAVKAADTHELVVTYKPGTKVDGILSVLGINDAIIDINSNQIIIYSDKDSLERDLNKIHKLETPLEENYERTETSPIASRLFITANRADLHQEWLEDTHSSKEDRMLRPLTQKAYEITNIPQE